MEALTEDWRLHAARCLEAEARRQDFGTFLKLTLIATEYRLEVIRGAVGDCVTGENTQPPFTCPAKSPGHGRDDSTSLGG